MNYTSNRIPRSSLLHAVSMLYHRCNIKAASPLLIRTRTRPSPILRMIMLHTLTRQISWSCCCTQTRSAAIGYTLFASQKLGLLQMGILFFSPLDQIKTSAGSPLLSKANFNSSFVQEVLYKSSSSGPNTPPNKKEPPLWGFFFFWVLRIPLQNNKLLHLPGSAAVSTASC
jgi:hypothetical protein